MFALRSLTVAALFGTALFAQGQQHVHWSLAADGQLVRAEASIDPGWHLYSASTPAGLPAQFRADAPALVQSLTVFQPPPKRAFDPNFNSETETFEGQAVFLLRLKPAPGAPAGAAAIPISVRYQTCNDQQCVPGRWTGTVNLAIDPAAAVVIPPGYAEAAPAPPSGSSAPPTTSAAANQGLAAFLAVAFGFGLASIFTPCVFPMIPITLSYFLNRQAGGRREGVIQAVVFCLGIVVLFSGLGLGITAILGPLGVVQLGANPWVNGFIAALFIAFGLSLLGAFEITIPSSVLTRLNKSSEGGGFAGTLLMGLTFSLASFACVGPFVGTLLAASVGGGGARPLAGMVAFAAGLALPFFLLALFPSYLKRLPRSGAWMSRVKIVMGFVILAASLKYLASLDQVMQWGFLTRERFLAAWIVLFAMAGLYLLGFVRLEGIKPDDRMGMGRLLLGMAFLVFAISLVPGMFGRGLGDLDAYVPQSAGQVAATSGSAGPSEHPGPVWLTDYHAAVAKARAENKLLFIDFTGYACANCHWMQANILPRPEIATALGNFVPVELYTDGTDAASEANAKLQLDKFKTVALPFYVILDPDEHVIATFDHLTHDPAEFLRFLETKPPASQAPQPPAASGASWPNLTRIEGGPLPSAALQGKVVVMDFWATYCVPCIQEIPGFNKLQQEYAAKGVVVVGVSMDEDGADLVQQFLKKHPMQYTVALGSDAVSKQYKLDALPVTVVFDRSGRQVKRFEGFTPPGELRAAVEKAL